MDLRYEHYCLADQHFYDVQGRSGTVDGYSRMLPPLGADWSQTSRDVWRVLTPQGLQLRPQGWKIHISGTPANAERVPRLCQDRCFPGNQLMRLSMDLNTGGAGVLLALAGVNDDRVGLPFLARQPHTVATGD